MDETKYKIIRTLYKSEQKNICIISEIETYIEYLYKENKNKNVIEGNSILKDINSDYFPKYVDEGINYYILEYVNGIDLFDYIVGKPITSRLIFKHIALAVKYLHSKNIIHGDIKPENIIFTNDNITPIKIIDFDTAFYKNDIEKRKECIFGTEGFISPEAYYDSEYSDKSDIFSLGVTFYNIFTRRLPYKNNDTEYIFPYPVFDEKYLLLSLYVLLKKMLCIDVNLRYNIDQVLEHPYFQNY